MSEEEKARHRGPRGPQKNPHIGKINRDYRGFNVRPKKQKPCKRCKELFLPNTIAQEYCSILCRKKSADLRWKEYYADHYRKIAKAKKKWYLKHKTKYYWICPECRNKLKLGFAPRQFPQKLDKIKCKCGFNNKIKVFQ